MIMKQIDNIDRKIITALENDAYVSSQELSKALDICAPTIRRRVNRLIRDEIIHIQATHINRIKLSLTVSIVLKIENNAIARTAELLARQKEVGFLMLTAGQYNMVLLGWFESMEAYSKFLNSILYPLDGVLETDIFICVGYKKYAFVALTNNYQSTNTVTKQVDDIDSKIISALEKDAHQNSAGLAKSLNISAPTVRRRIKNLLDYNIIRIQAIPNLRMGKMITAIISIQVESNSVDRIADLLAGRNEVRQVLFLTGNFDIGIWAWFGSIEEFASFLNNVLNPMEGVTKKQILIQTEIVKWAHKW